MARGGGGHGGSAAAHAPRCLGICRDQGRAEGGSFRRHDDYVAPHRRRSDTGDAMYVLGAIAVGLGAGVGALEASAALSGLFNGVVVALWKWNASPPDIADIALGEQPGSRQYTGLPVPTDCGMAQARGDHETGCTQSSADRWSQQAGGNLARASRG
jgi:hypothetical protein